MQTVREIYTQTIRPLGEGERLELATLILEEITSERTREAKSDSNGSLSELFGSVSLGHPTGADNESIDADLAREYGNDANRYFGVLVSASPRRAGASRNS